MTWGELLWLVATWHVMSRHLMCWSCHLMRCDCLCCVMSRDALRCHVMCAHVKSCHLLCPAMGWNVMRLNCHYSLNNYSVLQSTTPVLLQHYSVLQSTTPVLLQHYSSTTLYYKLLLCTTNCYSSTTHTAPATQNECHQVSASHMKRHFQCASPSNVTKYCACHAK